MTASRFPPPWSVEEQSACYVVRDHDGHQLAYYFEDEPGREQHPTLTLAEAMDALWWHGGRYGATRWEYARQESLRGLEGCLVRLLTSSERR